MAGLGKDSEVKIQTGEIGMCKLRTISVPIDLDGDISQYKDQINISRVCQKALRETVEKIKRRVVYSGVPTTVRPAP